MSITAMRLKSTARLEHDADLAYRLNAAHRLWHRRMMVYVPFYATQSIEQTKMYGNCYSSNMTRGERDILHKEMVKTWMAPIRQISLYAQGIPIAYPDKIKAVEIYQDIKQHIENWSNLTVRSLNKNDETPPPEDFELMLEFAECLEIYLDYYYHQKTCLSGDLFRRQTMNKFTSSDKYAYRRDSTYQNLREGIYSFQNNRTARKEDTTGKLQASSPSSHYQEVPAFTQADADRAMADIRGNK